MTNEIIPLNNDILGNMLDDAHAASTDFGSVREENRITNVIEIVTGKGTRHDAEKGVGKLYVGPADDVNAGKYVSNVNILLVDVLALTNEKGYLDAARRGMWGFVKNGDTWQRDLSSKERSCYSANGISPLPQYIGAEVPDLRTNKVHKIGYNVDGTPISDRKTIGQDSYLNICGKCPLGQWIKNADGKFQPPACQNSTMTVVYVLPDENFQEGFLATLQGANNGVERSIWGAKRGDVAAKHDGEALPGIRAAFQARSKETQSYCLRYDTVPQSVAQKFGIGFAMDETGAGFVKVPFKIDGILNPDWVQFHNSETHKFIVITVPTYEFAPKGRPEDILLTESVFANNPVYGVKVTSVKNGFKLQGQPNPTRVYDFNVDVTTTVNESNYLKYLEAKKEYFSSGLREKMFGLGRIATTEEVLKMGITGKEWAAQQQAIDTTTTEDTPSDEMPF